MLILALQCVITSADNAGPQLYGNTYVGMIYPGMTAENSIQFAFSIKLMRLDFVPHLLSRDIYLFFRKDLCTPDERHLLHFWKRRPWREERFADLHKSFQLLASSMHTKPRTSAMTPTLSLRYLSSTDVSQKVTGKYYSYNFSLLL